MTSQADNQVKPEVRTESDSDGSLRGVVGMRRGFDIICLAPEGFSSRKVANIRQAMCQVEMLLETGATKIGIYAQSNEAQPNDKLCEPGANNQKL